MVTAMELLVQLGHRSFLSHALLSPPTSFLVSEFSKTIYLLYLDELSLSIF